MNVGTVAEIWRYPVKSMQGEQVDAATIETRGLAGDRAWAVRDDEAGEIRGGRQLPKLLLCSARFTGGVPGEDSPPVEITFPGGTTLSNDDPALDGELEALLGRKASLWPLLPAENLDHYRRGKVRSADPQADIRKMFALLDDDPLPDFSDLAGEPPLRGFSTPPGAYYDIAPVHLVTTASLAELGRRGEGLDTDRRRFRPNLLIDTGEAAGFSEFEWIGKRLQVGEVVLELRTSTVRCAITTHEQPGIEHDPQIMRTLVRETEHRLGLYVWVVEPGAVRVGDEANLVD